MIFFPPPESDMHRSMSRSWNPVVFLMVINNGDVFEELKGLYSGDLGSGLWS